MIATSTAAVSAGRRARRPRRAPTPAGASSSPGGTVPAFRQFVHMTGGACPRGRSVRLTAALAGTVWLLVDGVPSWVGELGWWWAGLALIGVAVVCVVALALIVDGWARGELDVVRRPCSGHVQRADSFARGRDAQMSGRAR